jgi:hypothetical protein
MMIPCALRGAGELIDVATIDVHGELHLCLFDRTPGASGFAHHVAERSLGALLTLGRLALGRLVGPELARLWHIHDTTPGADPSRWDIDEALRWLSAILDAPAVDAPTFAAPERPRGPRCEHAGGSRRGDLGRLWVTQSGRSDDLVWTRQRWWAPQGIAGQPAGEVQLDIAVERPLVARARRAPDDHEVQATLAMIRQVLARLFAERIVDGVLGMVAAIPTSARPLAASERAPLVVLARRRADLEAKHALAAALLPEACAAQPTTVGGRPALELRSSAGVVVVDVAGPQVRTADPNSPAEPL